MKVHGSSSSIRIVTHPEWFQMCGEITIIQAQCNDLSGTYIKYDASSESKNGPTWSPQPTQYLCSLVIQLQETVIIWGGFRCVVTLSWLKPHVMVLHHPSETDIKYFASRRAITGLIGSSTPTILMFTKGCAWSTSWPIRGSFGYVVTLPWPKPNVTVLHHPSETYINYDTLPGNKNWSHLTPNIHNPHAY